MNLLNVNITTALAAQLSRTFQSLEKQVRNLAVEFNFTYVASAATSVDAYLQTTFDEGVTWVDIANFHATTASLKHVINLSSLTPVTTPVVPTDGSLASNTAVDGLFGDYFRVKWTSVGTYGANTNLQVNVASASRLVAKAA